MEALRQILNVENHLLQIKLPESFDASRVEVIVLAVDEEKPRLQNPAAKFRGSLSKQNPTDIDKQLSDLRNEWN